MTPIGNHSDIESNVWSAHNLPKPATSPMLAFSALAVVAGLIVIVLASSLGGPIRTTGTQMEPARFQTTLKAQPAPAPLALAATAD